MPRIKHKPKEKNSIYFFLNKEYFSTFESFLAINL